MMAQDSAGLYIHIPFCRRRCHYCSFYSTAGDSVPEEYIDALLLEIKAIQSLRLNYSTVYFGGGTPSLLSSEQFNRILSTTTRLLRLSGNSEITVEVNPDSASLERLKSLRQSGANRISIGIQSLDNATLRFLGRIHTSEQSISAVENARKAGFDNLSLDLIYGIPGFPLNQSQLGRIVDLTPEHLATYCLSIDPGTLLFSEIGPDVLDDEQARTEYDIIRRDLLQQGYEHYEISAFCQPGRPSRHNSGYWTRKEYIGIGPSASSFYGERRWRNTEEIGEYCAHPLAGIENLKQYPLLAPEQKAIELVMLELRRISGISRQILNEQCMPYLSNLDTRLEQYIADGFLVEIKGNISISAEHLYISDSIIEGLVL